MALVTLIVRCFTLLASLLLFGLSIAVFYTSGDAARLLGNKIPEGKYTVWYGPLNGRWGNPDPSYEYEWAEQAIELHYDGSTETFIWVAAALSMAIGLLSFGIEIARLFRLGGFGKDRNAATSSTALSIGMVILPVVTFAVSLGALIYGKEHPKKVEETTCDWEASGDHSYTFFKPGRDSYTCTRAQASCNIIGAFSRIPGVYVGDECQKLHIAQILMIPLTVFAGIVAFAYILQMVVDKKQTTEGVDADERVRRLQEEDDE